MTTGVEWTETLDSLESVAAQLTRADLDAPERVALLLDRQQRTLVALSGLSGAPLEAVERLLCVDRQYASLEHRLRIERARILAEWREISRARQVLRELDPSEPSVGSARGLLA